MPAFFRGLPYRLLVAGAAMTTMASSLAMAAEEEILLRVGGAEGTSFTADCSLSRAGGSESFTVEQSVPFEARYSGRGLSCRISSQSAIEIEVVKGGSRSRSSISGGVVHVNVGS